MNKIIYCPECAREIYKLNDRQTMSVTVRCDCGKYFEIDAIHKMAKRTTKPERFTSSGVTFY